MTTFCTVCGRSITPSELPNTVWREGGHHGERRPYHTACFIRVTEAQQPPA